jgi:peptidyl-tRNA hydrolase
VRQHLTHYCLVRQDLPRGVLAAQLIHAAGESSPGGLPENTFAVALAAKSEEHLLHLEEKLRRLSIPHAAIREPDAPWDGALMAIGLAPVADRNQVKKVTSSLPLLR